jgi:hypothetical protein
VQTSPHGEGPSIKIVHPSIKIAPFESFLCPATDPLKPYVRRGPNSEPAKTSYYVRGFY